MPSFTVRVELTNYASAAEYERVHFQMARMGFVRTVRSDQGLEFHLPPAEYNLENSPTTSVELRDAVLGGLINENLIGRVLVTEAASRAWSLIPTAPSGIPVDIASLVALSYRRS